MRIEAHTFMFVIIIYMYLPRVLAESNCNGTLHPGLMAKLSFPRYSNRIDHTLISNLEDMGGYKNKTLAHMWRDFQGQNWWNGLLDPINPVLKAEILRYGVFAQLCYDAFDSKLGMNHYGGCKYSLDNNLGVSYGYKVTKYLYAETDIILGRPIKRSVWIGFIAVCTDAQEIQRLGRRDILVAWRGTQTSREWIQDFTDFLVPDRFSRTAPVKDKGVRVEKGFLNCYTSVGQDSRCAKRTVLSEIIRLVDKYKDENLSVTLTGHSLGAALATLSSYDIKQILMAHSQQARSIPVTVFAFASPRVGNRAFSLQLEELGVKVLRLVNKNDLVPKLPGLLLNEKSCQWFSKMFDWLPWSYFHVGVQIVLNNNASPLLKHTYNPVFTHNLKVYLHLIDGYVGKGKPFNIYSGRDPVLVNKSCNLLIEDFGNPLVVQSSNRSSEIKFITLDNDMKYRMSGC